MEKKTLIQISLIVLLIFFSYFVFNKYFIESSQNNKSTIDNSSKFINKDYAEKKQDLIKNIKYTSNNAKGDIYELIADYGESSLEEPNLMFLTNVKGKIIFKNKKKPNIILTSKFANFNTVTFETTFIDDVRIIRNDEVITGNELYLVLDHEEKNLDNTISTPKEKNLIRMSKNIFFKKPGYTLKADILEIDLITKNTKIYMYDKLKKVTVTSLVK